MEPEGWRRHKCTLDLRDDVLLLRTLVVGFKHCALLQIDMVVRRNEVVNRKVQSHQPSGYYQQQVTLIRAFS